jgi:amino acid transporter
MGLALVVAGEQNALLRVAIGATVYAFMLLALGSLVIRKGRPSLNL